MRVAGGMIRSALLQDVRFALRGFLKSPGVTLLAVISIAIGIGANTAIFSVANALLLRPLPYADAERLVILWNRSPGLNIALDWFSTAQYFDIRNGHSGFEQVAIAIGGNQNLTGPFEPERIGVLRVSSNLLPMLGAKPALGRLFAPEEDAPGRPASVVLNYGTWKRRYGGDPGVIGRAITLNGTPSEVVGVLPEGFSLPREVLPTLGTAEDGEMFLPLPLAQEAVTDRGHEDYNVIAKLKPGITAAQAQVEIDAITRRLRADHPDVYPPNGGLTFGIVPLLDQVVGNVRQTLLVLVGSVAFVLLIACANVANLLLSRALSREKEIAVRIAVGASGRRLAFLLLVESLTLSFMGGMLGVALSFSAVRWIHLVQPKEVPRLDDIAVNGEALLFTILLCLAAGVLFGLAPALGARHVNPSETLVAAARGSTSANPMFGRGHRLRRLLVVAQIALSMVLLIGAGLLVRSFARLHRVAPGFDPAGVLTMELTLTGPRYADARIVRETYRDLWARLDALPGVTAAGGVTSLPLSGYFSWGPITIEGRTPPPGENFINADQRVVSGRYFEALGIPLLKGRFFNVDDTTDKDRVIIIDEFMADQYWPNQEPVGKRVRLGEVNSIQPWRTVVGVVGRVKQYGLDADGRIALYIPHTQTGNRAMYVAVKTSADPAALAASVKARIRAIDPDLPVYRVRTMSAWVDQSLARARFAMTLLTAFAGLALVLAALGIYGVMAFLVSQSTREIGIRIALGATERAVLGLVVRQGLAIVLSGAAVGVLAALALSRLIASLLFGVGVTDVATFAVAILLLSAVALLATYLPARRAARTDPVESLRMD
jgi:predicted permease